LQLALLFAAGAMLVSGCASAGADSAPGTKHVSSAPVADRRPVPDAPVTAVPADPCADACAAPTPPAPAAAVKRLPVQVLPGADLPVVTIRAVTDASMMVNDDHPCSNTSAASIGRGELQVTRTGAVDTPLTVHYTTAGTSSSNGDTEVLPNEITIPAGASSASVLVTPSSGYGPAPLHVHRSGALTLALADTDLYDVGAASTAEIALHFDFDLFGCESPQSAPVS
jgi:hypothetical protein